MTPTTSQPVWRGVIERYRELLPIGPGTPVITLLEGGTPLVAAPVLSARVSCDVFLKVEGANPTGSFDDCLVLARDLAEHYPVTLVNSVNPFRIQGQKTVAFEIVEALARAPDVHCIPVGNAGNITATWLGYSEAAERGLAQTRPRMLGFQAAGAAPLVHGRPVPSPSTIATAIRIGRPASAPQALRAVRESNGGLAAVTDRQIIAAYRLLAREEGVFVEMASAASVAGLLATAAAGGLQQGSLVVCTLTGNGLKDPDWAVSGAPPPTRVAAEAAAAAAALGLDDAEAE